MTRNSRNGVKPRERPRVGLAIDDRWREQGIEAVLTAEGFPVGDRNAELVLADAPRPWRDVHEALLRLRSRFPRSEILVFIPELRYEYAEPCFAAGAMGVLHFNSEPKLILQAVDAVHRGDIWAPRNLMTKAIRGLTESLPAFAASEFNFTRAERRVLRALRDELTNKEMANLLDVSEATVKFHIGRLLQKTHSVDRHQLRRIGATLATY